MHLKILDRHQAELLPFLSVFKKEFGLTGGTAIALHIGHRQSIDFDLFSIKPFSNLTLQRKILKEKNIEHVLVDTDGEYTIIINGVKVTFLYYPFFINFPDNLNNFIKIADLITLAALKAYALGRRAKWKDYVDLYFIMKDYYGINEIVNKSKNIFGENFNEKNFRAQLAYFDDIDYSEKIIYTKGHKVSDNIIKKDLTEFSLE